MTDLRKAAQEALEAMDELHRTGDTQVFDMFHRKTTEALRAALAAPSTFGAVVTITERATAQECAELCERAHHNVPPFTSYEEAAQDCADIIRKHFKIARPE